MKKTRISGKYLSAALFCSQFGAGLLIGLTPSAVAAQTDLPQLIADGQGHEHHSEEAAPHGSASDAHGAHGDTHDAHGDSHGGMHGDASGHGDGHHHGSINVSDADAMPSIQLVVHEDPINGWNLELITENFAFAPERVNGDSTINEGHAHLYINGEKIMRIYSNWHHLPSLDSGMNTVMVTLNANGHEEFLNQGEVVGSSVTVSVP